MQTIIDENELLINEVNYIYKSLFRKDPTKTLPKIVIVQYILANQKLLSKSKTKKSIDINLIMSKKLDIEAIEMVTRGSANSDLSKKFHILFFLLEVRADYYECFTNEKRTSPSSSLIFSGSFNVIASFNSSISSSTLFKIGGNSIQSNPTLAAFS